MMRGERRGVVHTVDDAEALGRALALDLLERGARAVIAALG